HFDRILVFIKMASKLIIFYFCIEYNETLHLNFQFKKYDLTTVHSNFVKVKNFIIFVFRICLNSSKHLAFNFTNTDTIYYKPQNKMIMKLKKALIIPTVVLFSISIGYSQGIKEMKEKHIDYEKLPKKVKSGIESSKFKDWEKKEVEKVKTDKGTMYELEVESKEGKYKEVYFNKKGKIAHKEEEKHEEKAKKIKEKAKEEKDEQAPEMRKTEEKEEHSEKNDEW
ncbi:MAG: hypothetical protein ABEH43_05575, partial [Flavobacteriales bacterium]